MSVRRTPKSRPATSEREALRRWGFCDVARVLPAYTAEHYDADVEAGAIVVPHRACPQGRDAFGRCSCASSGNPGRRYYLQRVRHKRLLDGGFVASVAVKTVCYDTWVADWWHSTSAWREIHSDPDADARREEVDRYSADARETIHRRQLDALDRLAGPLEPGQPPPGWWEAWKVLESVQRCLLAYLPVPDAA